MACMEHDCPNPKCKQPTIFNNDRVSPMLCPACGRPMIHRFSG